jgi:hypothetical protein
MKFRAEGRAAIDGSICIRVDGGDCLLGVEIATRLHVQLVHSA